MKTNLILILIIILFSVTKIFAEECGEYLVCPDDVEYPYIFCNPETGEKVSACIKGDPNNITDLPGYPGFVLNKVQLPVCQGKRWFPDPVIYTPSFRYFDNDPNAQQKIDIGHWREGPVVLQSSKMLSEFDEACEAWNCICGMQDMVKSYAECPSVINVKYTTNPKDFSSYKESAPLIKSTLAEAKNVCPSNFEYNDENAVKIVFNHTSTFLYGTEWVGPNMSQLQSFINRDFAVNANKDRYLRGIVLHYYYSTALHEIGHALGFAHYDIINETGSASACVGDNYGIMNSKETSDPHEGPPQELTQTDKCMFAKLYCYDLIITGILEEQLIETQISPNPTSSDATLTFDLQTACNLKIILNDLLGQELLELHNNFEQTGTFTKTFSTFDLPKGTYYLKIFIGKDIKVEKLVVN